MMIKLEVNGEQYEVDVKPYWTLLYVLREKLGLKGTKNGCGEGDCGACTVIMDGKSVHSCLVLAVQADGKKILTIEGLAKEGKLHPLQEAFVEHGAIQCGFCTPGMIMAAKALLDENPNPTREEIREAISGNICRCTGYVKIIKAIEAAAKKLRGS
jgi:carbon-monoxide dehydrogenase small subunit